MNENKKKMYDLSGPKTVEAMKKRHAAGAGGLYPHRPGYR